MCSSGNLTHPLLIQAEYVLDHNELHKGWDSFYLFTTVYLTICTSTGIE